MGFLDMECFDQIVSVTSYSFLCCTFLLATGLYPPPDHSSKQKPFTPNLLFQVHEAHYNLAFRVLSLFKISPTSLEVSVICGSSHYIKKHA